MPDETDHLSNALTEMMAQIIAAAQQIVARIDFDAMERELREVMAKGQPMDFNAFIEQESARLMKMVDKAAHPVADTVLDAEYLDDSN